MNKVNDVVATKKRAGISADAFTLQTTTSFSAMNGADAVNGTLTASDTPPHHRPPYGARFIAPHAQP